MRPLKVYGWLGFDRTGQVRFVIGAHSMAEAARQAGYHSPRQMFNLEETGNAGEIALATASPGVPIKVEQIRVEPHTRPWVERAQEPATYTPPTEPTQAQFTLRAWVPIATAEKVEHLLAEVARKLGGSLGRTEYGQSEAGTVRTDHRMVVKERRRA